MYGHDTHSVTPFLENRRLAGDAVSGVLAQPLDEAAERNAAGLFVPAGHFRDVQHVRERLLARRAQRESSVGARRYQETRDCFGHRNVVAGTVQRPQEPQHRGNELELLRHFPLGNPERMQPAEPVPVLQQRRIGDCEQGSSEGGEDRELIVRPLDRRECGSHGLDFFPLVKRPAADEEVRNPSRFQGLDVVPRDVAPELFEAAEEDAYMPRGERNA